MELMGISYALAETNYYRYKDWSLPYKEGHSRPAFAAFTGDVYEGLKSWELTEQQVDVADRHVRILSGLYGLLKPTDQILPYRLEMGTSLSGTGFSNLYEFWGDRITRQLAKELKGYKKKVVINLASAEYAKAANPDSLKARVITPFFMEFRNGAYKFIPLNGKKARGLMTRFILDKNISEAEEFKLFNYEGYAYDENLSDEKRWIFSR